jgi:hypothetical protein
MDLSNKLRKMKIQKQEITGRAIYTGSKSGKLTQIYINWGFQCN